MIIHSIIKALGLVVSDKIFSSPELKALSELIGCDSSWLRPSVHIFRHEYL